MVDSEYQVTHSLVLFAVFPRSSLKLILVILVCLFANTANKYQFHVCTLLSSSMSEGIVFVITIWLLSD